MSSRLNARAGSGSNYTRRINRVVNHLAAHPAQRFSIAQLAELANFSDFHFHRLFKAYTGETPAELARRLRLERAAADLIYQREPSITDLALTLGFSSSANFTKAFTAYFGVAPSRYAASHNAKKNINNRAKNSKAGKAPTGQDEDTSVNAPVSPSEVSRSEIRRSKQALENPGLDVVIEEQPLIHLAYIRHVGPYQPENISALFTQLLAWAEENQQRSNLTYGITWSDSSVAEPQTWRFDAAMQVTADTQASDGIDVQTLAAGKLAVLKLTLTPPDYSPIASAWDYLLSEWLPDSGWQPAHRPSFERYEPYDQGSNSKQTQMDLCLPIEPNR